MSGTGTNRPCQVRRAERRERERKGCSNSRAVRLYLTVQTTRLEPQLQSRRFSVREIVCEP